MQKRKKAVRETFDLVSWDKVRASVHKVNAELGVLLDDLDPGTSHSCLIANYPFGKDIVKTGRFFLPDNYADVISFDDERVPKAIRSLLKYAKIPIGLILDKTAEVYYETPERVIADKLLKNGDIFGVWELFDKPLQKDTAQLSNLAAGARSIFMLPKISDGIAHNRLKKAFNITLPPPRAMREHRDLFAELVKNNELKNEWKCKIIYFTDHWIKQKNNPAWFKLKNYLFQYVWEQSYNCRRQFELHIGWEKILSTMSQHNIYLSPKLSSHIKQLYLIAESVFPGMIFAQKNENEVAPINLIQEIYTDIYQLKNYAPILMHPCHIDAKTPVYYSLNYPNYFESFLPTKSQPRLMDEIRIIAETIEMIQTEIDFNPHPNFSYFHAQGADNHHIRSVDMLKDQEKSTQHYFKNKKNLKFPNMSPFFNGCVKIELSI
jgi:hypothetical protein